MTLLRAVAGRVARRYASRQLVKGAQQAFKLAKSRVEALLAAGDVAAARERFLELGRELQPLASSLDNVKLSRPDEQRKLKNVLERLRVLRYPFEDRFFEGDDTEQNIWMHQSLGQIGNVLKSLVAMADRIEGYVKLEKTFTHGPWVIDNKYGYSASEYNEPIAILDEASERVKSKGYGSLLYGKVVLDTKVHRPGAAAYYYEPTDTITLNVDAKHRGSAVFSVVHEIGHRRWFQELAGDVLNEYEDLYSASGVTLEQREDMWQALVKAEFKPGAAKKFLRDPSTPLAAYLKTVTNGAISKHGWAAYNRGEEWVEKNFILRKQRYVRLEGQHVETVSDYARKSVLEDYAETFATYVFNMPIAESIMKRFALTL